MWSLVVALPAVQPDFGVTRADISFAYTMNTLGFFAGGVAWVGWSTGAASFSPPS